MQSVKNSVRLRKRKRTKLRWWRPHGGFSPLLDSCAVLTDCARMILESACPEIESDGWHSAPGFGAYMFGTLSSILEKLRDKHSSVFFIILNIIIIITTFKKENQIYLIIIFYYIMIILLLSFSILAVPETASGLQGEQPLVHGVK